MRNIFAPLRLLVCLTAFGLAGAALSGDEIIKSRSPDGKFALWLRASGNHRFDAVIIDAKTRSALVKERDVVSEDHWKSAELIWSADSKRVAFRHYQVPHGSTEIHFWDGAKFVPVALPKDLPLPKPKKPKPNEAEIDHSTLQFDTLLPVRWLKSGSLELTRAVSYVLLYEDGTDENLESSLMITLGFDGKHHATVQKTEPIQNGKRSEPPAD